ncbi:hypothetical protein [Aquibacillus salsiterrae]|uniref:Uncharacterized protein n=1 Tax=Aquibacillus salsiterrae TaxID=2950439 RepID=A0A9X3WKC4_9BACI|nr:hypothetical protein [Aquibacillus salsiterrae]MDC3418681.1 hypothetical protein [Aquibacillus salsiterrae]
MNPVKEELYISMAAIFGGRPLNTVVFVYLSTVGIVHHAEKQFPLFPIFLFRGLVLLRLFARQLSIVGKREPALKKLLEALSLRLLVEFLQPLSKGGGKGTLPKLNMFLYGLPGS